MLLERLFRARPAKAAGSALYGRAVAQARTPALYTGYGVPDTPEGRFELYSLHVLLLIDRLQGRGEEAVEVSQALFDAYLSDLDHALRELGVGDLSVGRKMRKLGEAFYGRGKACQAAFSALPDEEPLIAFLTRTVYAEPQPAAAARLAAYLVAQREGLAVQPLTALAAGDVRWSAP